MCQPLSGITDDRHTDDNSDEDDFRPLVIDTSDNAGVKEAPNQNIFPSFEINPTNSTEQKAFAMKADNSIGSLRDYLEGPGIDLQPSHMEAKLESKQSKSSPSTKGTAPSKTRRKSDRILPVPIDDGIAQYICPICKTSMENMTEFTKHIRSHNTTSTSVTAPNSCTICGKVLSSQSSLDRHMLVHSGERPFKCNLCHMSFTTNGNMHRHMRIHEKEMALNSASMNPGPMNAEIKPKKKQRKKNLESKELLAHLNSPPQRIHSSPRPEPVTLKRHLETPISDCSTPPKKVMLSPTKPDEMEAQTHEPIEYPAIKLLSRASCKDDGQLECPLCMKTFLCAYGLDTHMTTAHGTQISLIPRCHACNITFRSVDLLHSHNLTKHMQSNEKTDNSNQMIGFQDLTFLPFSCDKFPIVAKAYCERQQRQSSSEFHLYQCKRCNHAFPCASALKLHKEAHAPEFPSTCVICDVAYGTRQEFYQHMTQHGKQEVVDNFLKLRGTDDNALQDTMSKEEFLLVLDLKVKVSKQAYKFKEMEAAESRDDLKDNKDYFSKLGLVGSKEGLSVTKILNRAENNLPHTPVKNESDDHDRTTSEEDEAKTKQDGPFTCIYCDDVFSNDRAYKGHVRGHLGLSPYKCNLCTYSSADKSTLIRHLRTHNGERPFKCLICDFAFTTKANCERHVRKKHGQFDKDRIETSIGYNQFMNEDQGESFASPDTVCKFCGEDFKFFRALKHHLRSHSSCRHKPYACRLCQHGFSTKANCIRHVQKQHTHIENNQLEAQIQVNEMFLSEDESEKQSTNSALRAHLARKGHLRIHYSSPFMQKKETITSPPIDHKHLAETRSMTPEEPLDLSRTGPLSTNNNCHALPMDLTVKRSPYPLLIPVYRPVLANKGEMSERSAESVYETSAVKPLPPTPSDSFISPPLKTLHSKMIPTDVIPTAPTNSFCRLELTSMPTPQTDTELAPIGEILNTTHCFDIHSLISTTPPLTPVMVSNTDLRTDNPKKKRNAYSESPHKLQCPFCSRAFPWISSLKRHILTHTGQKPYKCPQCAVTFSTKSNQERHMVRIHHLDVYDPTVKESMKNPYPCYECSDSFSAPQQLKIHYEEKHHGLSVPEILSEQLQIEESLPSTDEIFTIIENLEKHAVTDGNLVVFPGLSKYQSKFHAAADEDDEEDINDIKTTSEQCVTRPLPPSSTVTTSGESNQAQVLTCWKCPASFRDGNELQRHLKGHKTANDPFKCFLCEAAFTSRQDSLQHLTSQHPNEWSNIKAKKSVNSIMKTGQQKNYVTSTGQNENLHTDPTQRKVNCTLCPKRFWSLQDLRRHMRSHTGERPFQCSVCQTRFTLKHSMLRHMRKHECHQAMSQLHHSDMQQL